MNNTTPNRRRHAPRRVIAVDSDGSETEGLYDHNGSLPGPLPGPRSASMSRVHTPGRIPGSTRSGSTRSGSVHSGSTHFGSARTGSVHSSTGHSSTGHSGSAHFGSTHSDSVHSRTGHSGSAHSSPVHGSGHVLTGVGLSGSEAAVRMIQSRLNETNEENAALQDKLQQMEQGMAQLRQRTRELKVFKFGGLTGNKSPQAKKKQRQAKKLRDKALIKRAKLAGI